MTSNEQGEKGCKTERAMLGSGCGKRVTTTMGVHCLLSGVHDNLVLPMYYNSQ